MGVFGLSTASRAIVINSWSAPLLVALFYLPVLALAARKRPLLYWVAGAAACAEALSFYRSGMI
jgi:hypothetical protein